MHPGSIHRLLIIRLSSLGDILLTTPLLRSIKNSYPHILIDFILREEYQDLLKLNPHINKILTYTNHKFEKQILLNNIISQDYQLAVDLQNNVRSKEITRVLNCNVIKFNKQDFQKFLLVHFKINKLSGTPPIPVRYANTIPGFQLDEKGLEFFTNNESDSRLNSGKTFIGLCPGARHFTKRWPEEYFVQLGKLLTDSGYSVVLFGGSDDGSICVNIARQIDDSLNLCSSNNVLQTAADMKKCKAVICNDSGLMHLAAAVNVPVVALFGSTVKEFGFFPYNAKCVVLENHSIDCRPCTHIGKSKCPEKHFKCMLDILPEEVFIKLRNLMGN